jgi:ubiquinone/menaquinone biosynthesis C-methylase UbiE
MTERLYTEHPRLYEAIQSHWPYDRDVDVVGAAAERAGLGPDRLLELGCGTGEHTRRFVDRGFEVTAGDKHEGMLEVAPSKYEADFPQQPLPQLAQEDEFTLAVAIRGSSTSWRLTNSRRQQPPFATT